MVDTLGLLLKVIVTEGDVGERTGAEWLLNALGGGCPRLKLVWVDGGFNGREFIERIQRDCQLTLEVVTRPEQANGCVLLHWRWVVERTFAWLLNYRRLSKDYEYTLYSADAMIYAAMTHLMVRRLARLQAPS